MSRLRSSRGSDSQVKSGCSHLMRDVLILYLGFWDGTGACSPGKNNRNLRSSKLLEKH